MRPWRKRDLLERVQTEILKSDLGVDGIAEHLHKAPSSLYKEISPTAEEAPTGARPKFGFLDWVKALGLHRNFGSLRAVAKIYDFVLVPTPHPDHAEKNFVQHLASNAAAFGDHLSALSKLMTGCRETRLAEYKQLAADALRECEELVVEAATVREHLKLLRDELEGGPVHTGPYRTVNI